MHLVRHRQHTPNCLPAVSVYSNSLQGLCSEQGRRRSTEVTHDVNGKKSVSGIYAFDCSSVASRSRDSVGCSTGFDRRGKQYTTQHTASASVRRCSYYTGCEGSHLFRYE